MFVNNVMNSVLELNEGMREANVQIVVDKEDRFQLRFCTGERKRGEYAGLSICT